MSEWTCRKLGELITVKHGFAFKGEYFGDDPAGPILVTPGNFAIGGGFRKAKVKSYSGPIPEGFVLSAGDLVVTMTDLSKAADALGYPALIPEGLTYLHNQRIGKIEILDATQLDKGFLQYALRVDAYRRHVVNGATGTTVKHTSPTRICEYVISLPSLPEQRAIASLLGALDDKIAINERIVRTCRELAGALFQQAVLNPESRTVPLGEIALHKPGKYLSKDAYAAGGSYAVYGSNSVMGWHSAYLYEGRFAVLARIGSKCGAIRWSNSSAWVNNNASAIIPRDPNSALILRHALDTVSMAPHRAGSAQPFIRVDSLMATDVTVPAESVQGRVAAQLEALSSREATAETESRQLAQMRDTLLPQLMSGRLRVKDAEKTVEDAT